MIVLYATLYIILIIVNFIGTGFAFYHLKNKEVKLFWLGFAFFFLLHGVGKIFYYFYDLVIAHDLLYLIATIISISSLIAIIFATETQVVDNTRHIFTIAISIALAVFVFVPLPDLINYYIQLIIFTGAALLIPILYLYIAYKSAGSLRKNALILAVGAVALLIGNMLKGRVDAESTVLFNYYVLGPIFIIIAIIIIMYGVNMQGKEE